MRIRVAGIGFVLMAQVLLGQTATQGSKHLSLQVPAQTATQVFAQVRPQASIYAPHGIVSDWTQRHVLYPESRDESVMERNQSDPRWLQSWYLRHPEVWWPVNPRRHRGRGRRDWSVPLSVSPTTSAFEPFFNFEFTNGIDAGYGSLTTTDNGGGTFLATLGSLTVTAGHDIGTYPLYPGGPGVTNSPSGYFTFDDLVYPAIDPGIDLQGLLFVTGTFEINIFSEGADNYEFYDNTGYNNAGPSFILNSAPGGGQTSPAKFVFDVNSAPSCANDYVVIGIPATPASGGQANILGVNNLYSGVAGALCPTGPTVMFAYASGSGQVPASVSLAQNGTKIVYIENLPSGSSYFHVLTLGTTSNEGTSATAAVVPGTGGSNAVDERLLLSPDGGTTNQSSTNAPFLVYTSADLNDVAYVTTYSTAGGGSGYLYKISNVFHGVPTIVWSAAIAAVPSTPVFDQATNQIFFTDSLGNIDYVVDDGTSASAVTSLSVAAGTTSENPVILDGSNQMIYATFNSNGTNALVVQAPTSLASFVAVPVGAATNVYTGPYEPDFNNAWYTGSGTPVLYVAGTGSSGTTPTLYSVGFNGSGVLNSSADATTAALTTGAADSSPITDFYNASNATDYLFVGVTNDCVATDSGGTAGCVMSLDITNGFPTVGASSTALAAPGGTTGIVVDNNSTATGASSIYYATKTGANLVKATQSGLN